MRSIRNITIAVGMALLAITIQAQDKTLLQTEMLAKQLELTEKQKVELDKQLKQAKADREMLESRIKALQEEVKRDAFVRQQEHEARMKSLLTPEQFAKYQEVQKRTRVRRMQGQRAQQRQGRFQNGRQGTGQRDQFRQRSNNGRQSLRFRQRGQNQNRGFAGFNGTPEERQAMMKKFQEFLEQEKKKSGGGN